MTSEQAAFNYSPTGEEEPRTRPALLYREKGGGGAVAEVKTSPTMFWVGGGHGLEAYP